MKTNNILAFIGIVLILIYSVIIVVNANEVNVILDSSFGYEDNDDSIRQEARYVDIEGDYVYAVNGEGNFQIIDISNSESPKLAGDYDTGGKADIFEISDDYAYLVYSECSGNASLNVIDISNPSSPYLAGSYDLDLTVDDVGVRGIESSDGCLCLTTYSGLVILDINDPRSPVFVSRYDTLSAPDVAVEGDHACIVSEIDGLWLVNISDPSSPDLVGTCDMIDYAGSIAVSDGYAYLTGYNGSLKVVDIHTPSSPTIVSNFDNVGSVQEVVVKDDYAYLSCPNQLFVVDISNPLSPAVVGGYATSTFSFGLDVEDNHVCITDEYNSLSILRTEILDPATYQNCEK